LRSALTLTRLDDWSGQSQALIQGDGIVVVDPVREGERGVSIVLRYQGPAVDDGTMDVYEVAANMVAFSDYVVAATHKLYGEEVKVKAEVNAFQQGSFVTDLTFQVLGVAGTIFAATPDMQGVVSVVKESLGLFNFLQGQVPEKVERTDNSNNVTVTNVNGNVTIVQTESLTLTLDEKAAKAAAQFIGDALSKPGVQRLEITSERGRVAQVTDNDARFFHPIVEETPLLMQTVQMGLTIQEPSFKDGLSHKWTMWDGEASLQYAMEDEDFIARVDNGEPFRKGDVLVCNVRITQTKIGAKLKIQRAIVRVHSHKNAHEQGEMEL
jgi:hypothetical protein